MTTHIFPGWTDSKGNLHDTQDDWATEIEMWCMRRLSLSYRVITVEIDSDDYCMGINSQGWIVSKDIYDRLDCCTPSARYPNPRRLIKLENPPENHRK